MLSPRSRLIKSFCTSPVSSKKSDGTPKSYSLRRSPRKSAKRLVFPETATTSDNHLHHSNSDHHRDHRRRHHKRTHQHSDTDPSKSRTDSTVNPHLVFDGENASDVNFGSNHSSILEGLKTPEKRRLNFPDSSGDHYMPTGAVSMPSFPNSSLSSAGEGSGHKNSKNGNKKEELSFKNAFSSQLRSESPRKKISSNCDSVPSVLLSKSLSHLHPSSLSSSSLSTPTTLLQQPPVTSSTPFSAHQEQRQGPQFSSPDQAAKLRSSFLLSPKKKSPAKAGSFLTHGHGLDLLSTSRSKEPKGSPFKSPSKRRPHSNFSSPTKRLSQQPYIDDDDHIVYSTPTKKSSLSFHSRGSMEFHATPSKVTFKDECLASSPKLASNPSSALKMTPKKSILKNSPAFKANLSHKLNDSAFNDLSPQKNPVRRLSMSIKDLHPSAASSSKRSATLNEVQPSLSSKVNSTISASSSQSPLRENNSIANNNNSNDVRTFDKMEQSPKKSIAGVKRRMLSFDLACSSSNESSNHIVEASLAAKSTTVIPVHTPSPAKKCASSNVNQWMRKKRLSGSRTSCSSSSSSPSLFSSSSSSSSDGKKKRIEEALSSNANTNVTVCDSDHVNVTNHKAIDSFRISNKSQDCASKSQLLQPHQNSESASLFKQNDQQQDKKTGRSLKRSLFSAEKEITDQSSMLGDKHCPSSSIGASTHDQHHHDHQQEQLPISKRRRIRNSSPSVLRAAQQGPKSFLKIASSGFEPLPLSDSPSTVNIATVEDHQSSPSTDFSKCRSQTQLGTSSLSTSSPLSPSTSEAASKAFHNVTHSSPNPLSKSKWSRMTGLQSSGSFGDMAVDGSQGFEVDPPSAPHAASSSSTVGNDWTLVSHANEDQIQPDREKQQQQQQQYLDQTVNTPSPPNASTKTKSPSNAKSQFSPALTSSGLLQLIKSPLLDANSRKRERTRRRETRSRQGKSKSRQHLKL